MLVFPLNHATMGRHSRYGLRAARAASHLRAADAVECSATTAVEVVGNAGVFG